MTKIDSKIIVITGASSGIGEATAKLLAKQGATVMLAARREDRLQKLVNNIKASGGQASFKVTDVTNRGQIEELFNTTIETYGQVDILINNAGLMPLSPLSALKVDEWDQMIDVNIKGLLYAIAAALPVMQKRKQGQIVNIASVAGLKVFPSGAVYCATKFAVRAISEGIRLESNGDIRSTIISPGSVNTELTDHISHEETAEKTKGLYQGAIDADAIARAILYAVEQPQEVDINEIVVRPTQQEL
ncbi:MAG: SDR family oxidoreductase [Desulforhopalus sp.]